MAIKKIINMKPTLTTEFYGFLSLRSGLLTGLLTGFLIGHGCSPDL